MSQYLYLILNIGSLSVPLLYSIFAKQLNFIKYFKAAFISILLVAIPFLIWDAIFTANGVWGFNSDYHLSIEIFEMPIEEWLFFFCIPYACLFTHEVLKYLFPQFKLSKSVTIIVSFLLILITGILLIYNFGRLYTTVNFSYFLFLIIYGLKNHTETLQEYLKNFPIFTFMRNTLAISFLILLKIV